MSHYQVVCLECAAIQTSPLASFCDKCGGVLGFHYDYATVRWDDAQGRTMWRYWPLLPIDDPDHIATLGEGGTPLLRSRTFATTQVFLKDETRNPTGSHKDRSLSVAINHARRVDKRTSFVVSTGSTGISNAALAARAGIHSVVIMTEGTPADRVYPMYALGSKVVEVRGEIDAIIDQVIALCRTHNLYLSSTSRASNPYQAEGNKTIAYEIVEQLGHAPDWVVVPVGGGGTLAGILRGFQDLQALDRLDTIPRLAGVVPHDYNALEVAFNRGLTGQDEFESLPFDDSAPTILVKLAHSHPPDGLEALAAVRTSGGHFLSVTDQEALAAQAKCGRNEGLYVEPSTGACLAGLEKLLASGRVARDESVVAIISGSGFRENFVTMQYLPLQKQTITVDHLTEVLLANAAHK